MADTNTTYTEAEKALIAQADSFGGFTQTPIGIGQYPYVTVEETASGHVKIEDNTVGSEKLVEIHRTGTYTAILPDGSQENKIVGKNVVIVEKDNFVTITGACNITIHGNSEIVVKGNKTEIIEGDYTLQVNGNYRKAIVGDYDTTVKGDAILSVSPLGIGSYRVLCNKIGGVYFDADLFVDGTFNASAIRSSGHINADTGIMAVELDSVNTFAGIHTLGGISAGFPGPAPIGFVNAKFAVNTVAVNAVVVKDVRGTMEGIRQTYNIHTHPHPRGPTGLPLILM
jgi:hypothetical protein